MLAEHAADPGPFAATTQRPLRVLLFSTLFPSSVRPGHGVFIQTRLHALLHASEDTVQARVVAPVPWFPFRHARFGTWSHMAATPAAENLSGMPVQHPRYALLPRIGQTMAPFSLALGAWPTLRRLRREGFDFDVIDAHYFYPDGVAAALLARWSRRPLVITARGSDLYVLGKHWLARLAMQWAAGQAQACVGVCRALTDVLRGWGVRDERLHVLPNGVDLQRFTPRPRDAAQVSTGVTGAPALLCVGNLVAIKGHALAIDALAVLRRTHHAATLTLVGDGPAQAALQAQAARLGLQDAVRFVGRVPHDALSDWYSAADLTILPSHSEGWANVLLESMACGVPVISTDVGGSAEVIASPVAGALLHGRDPQELAALILERLATGGDRGAVRQYAEGFGWQRTAQSQLLLLRQVAGQAAARP